MNPSNSKTCAASLSFLNNSHRGTRRERVFFNIRSGNLAETPPGVQERSNQPQFFLFFPNNFRKCHFSSCLSACSTTAFDSRTGRPPEGHRPSLRPRRTPSDLAGTCVADIEDTAAQHERCQHQEFIAIRSKQENVALGNGDENAAVSCPTL